MLSFCLLEDTKGNSFGIIVQLLIHVSLMLEDYRLSAFAYSINRLIKTCESEHCLVAVRKARPQALFACRLRHSLPVHTTHVLHEVLASCTHPFVDWSRWCPHWPHISGASWALER